MKKILCSVLLLVTLSSVAFAGKREGRIQAGGGVGLGARPPVRFDLQSKLTGSRSLPLPKNPCSFLYALQKLRS